MIAMPKFYLANEIMWVKHSSCQKNDSDCYLLRNPKYSTKIEHIILHQVRNISDAF